LLLPIEKESLNGTALLIMPPHPPNPPDLIIGGPLLDLEVEVVVLVVVLDDDQEPVQASNPEIDK
jgi:hypothetical protein